MAITYEEIMMKYVEGGLSNGLDWIIKNLEEDPDVISGADRKKINLLRFINDMNIQLKDFLSEPDADPRDNLDNKDVFGDDDIVVGPGGTSTDFLEPPEGEEPPEDGFEGFSDEEDDGL